VRILFLGRHYTYFRNFESVLRELARRGHHIHLAVERDDRFSGNLLVESLQADFPNVTFGRAVDRPDDDWRWTAHRLRRGLDYLRYQLPIFDSAYKLRARARELTPGAFVLLGDAVHALGGWSRRLATRLLYRLETAVPDPQEIREYIEAQRPDIVLVSPLIDLGSAQIDYLRAARRLGIPTALCVWSWDNLSSKALIRESPDRVFVWNETQREEAVQFHGLAADHVVVTGAQCFDQWFDREPSRDRAEFCRQVGLDPERPFLLYVCSALFKGSPVEAGFVVDWIKHLRASASPSLRDVGILVRPHPARLEEWADVDVASLDAVVWGSNPVHKQAKEDYFDSLYHSAAVVGLNTSAFIEAGIVGRSVHTLIVPEFEENQTATVHFDYLLKVGGGLLEVAHGLDEHAAQIEQALAHPRTGPKPFVREFVRPHGLDRAATPIFVEQVEAMQSIVVEAESPDSLARLSRWVVGQLARTRGREGLKRWTMSSRERESAARLDEFHVKKDERRERLHAETAGEREARMRRRAEREEERERLRQAKTADKQRRLAEKRARRDEEALAKKALASHGSEGPRA
jgi:hypothetical protein